MSSEDYIEDDPQWYKDAVIYEVHVKAYCDTAGDGIGDFKGLTSKLDYIKELGVTTLWLLPFYPSPLKDDGYDISDHFEVHPLYGTLADFKEFMREAHKRGLRVITELVLNHTSDQHPWFKKSRTAVDDAKWRDFYVWSKSPDKYREARIIFKDFESSNWAWDNVAKAYYWHRFYSHQPDLNFDNDFTQKTMLSVVAYWMKLGVDGLRLDAVPYLYEREGTNCENLPETHEFLKKLRAFIDSSFKDRMLLAEANQWPADAAQYFGNGDECNMAYHFPLMPRMFMAIQMEDRFPIIDILQQTPPIPESSQWALFLRNHDELTLEMVTDEERDYMYRVYARDKQARLNLGIRRRLAPLLGNDRRKIELMNILLFTLPGTPVIYYGDEIGMGDNFYLGDRNGVRTPMQWSADLNAGFSKTNPQKLYLPVIIEPLYHYEAINVENQQNDPASLFWWMKRIIAIRKNFKAFSRGSIEFLYPNNTKILAFTRKFGDETLLVTANLSGRTQAAEFDLSQFGGCRPTDVFGGSPFPEIGKTAYRLTFTPHGYYVFNIKYERQVDEIAEPVEIPRLEARKKLQEIFAGRTKDKLESEILPNFLRANRWFGRKGRTIEQIRIRDVITLAEEAPGKVAHFIVLSDIYYTEGLPESYILPMAYSSVDISEQLKERNPSSILATVSVDKNTPGVLFDAVYDESFRAKLLDLIINGRETKGMQSEISGSPIERDTAEDISKLKSSTSGADQSNTSLIYGDKFILKLLRRIEEGVNPEVEISSVLKKNNFEFVPKLIGSLSYRAPAADSATVGILEQFVRNEGDAWSLFQGQFDKFLEAVFSKRLIPTVQFPQSVLEISEMTFPEPLLETIGQPFEGWVALLGRRTGEFHLALLREVDDPNFTPEPFGYLEQVAVAQSMTSYSNRIFQLSKNATGLPDGVKKELDLVLSYQIEIAGRLAELKHVKLDSVRSRIHGDYHLGQVLFTGKNFIIIDFEGEPARSLSDRRLKRSPIKDVAGMIRSFHYAAFSVLLKKNNISKDDRELYVKAAEVWYKTVSGLFLRSYLNTVANSPILPSDKKALSVLLNAYLLEKSVYELGYELNNRPQWVAIPLKGIEDLIGIKMDVISAPKNIPAQ
ncbi:MAG: maltose alpha-D-glucosyltransferase [Thaumarchaeota archaeon]|nr:maltose alpha-D-glucosyltransferase [Nitrososphaerota archaeon]